MIILFYIVAWGCYIPKHNVKIIYILEVLHICYYMSIICEFCHKLCISLLLFLVPLSQFPYNNNQKTFQEYFLLTKTITLGYKDETFLPPSSYFHICTIKFSA